MATNDFICLNNLPKTLEITNPKGVYIYDWYDAYGFLKSSTDTFLEVNSSGVYTVIATSIEGCVSFEKQLTLTDSNSAEINAITVNNDPQNISITIGVTGLGDYEYSLNVPQGAYQDENTFNNVPPGIHTVYVNDKNGCGFKFDTVFVLGFPRFFTPNNDTSNDTWNIRGVDSSLFSESTIYIYDRYGKLLYSMTALDNGWDGTYNGEPMPSTDYWFVAELKDNMGNVQFYRDHFSLIRR